MLMLSCFMRNPEYLAPEIVLNYGMDQTADVWAFGIIAYEMLMFSTPFADEDGTKVFSKIASVMVRCALIIQRCHN